MLITLGNPIAPKRSRSRSGSRSSSSSSSSEKDQGIFTRRLQAELDDKLRGSEDLVWLRSWPSSFFGKMGHGYGHLIKSLHTLPPWMPARPASRSLIRTRNLSSFASQPWPTLHASLSTAMRAVGGQPMSDLKEWLLATVQLHNCIA